MKLILHLVVVVLFEMLKRIFVIIYPPYNITTQGRKHEMASQLPCSFNLFAHQQTLRFLLELYCGTITEPGCPVSKPAGRLR